MWDNGYRNLDFQVLRVTECHQKNNVLAEPLKTKMRARTKGRRLLRSKRTWTVWTRPAVGGRCWAPAGSESKGTTAVHWASREDTWAKLNTPAHKPRESDAWVQGAAVGMLRPEKSGSVRWKWRLWRRRRYEGAAKSAGRESGAGAETEMAITRGSWKRW